MSSIKGKTALVTGGSKGIGLGIAEALVREGLNVTITARSEEQVEEAAAKLNEQGPGRALGLVCDVRSLEEQQRVTERTVAEFGQLDVVIANAGVGGFGAVDKLDVDTWNSVIDTNLTGV